MTADKMAECVWVKPEIIVQFNFVNWTDANNSRYSTFVGIRENKRPIDAVKKCGRKLVGSGSLFQKHNVSDPEKGVLFLQTFFGVTLSFLQSPSRQS